MYKLSLALTLSLKSWPQSSRRCKITKIAIPFLYNRVGGKPLCQKNIAMCQKQHIEWINTIRVFTLLLVILGHCNYYTINTIHGGIINLTEDGYYCYSFNVVKTVTRFIYSFHMQVFMALSGMCFSFSKLKYAPFKTLVSKKSKRLLWPFLLVTTFLSVPLKYIVGYWSNSASPLYDIFFGQYLMIKGNTHLWFLVALFNIFVLFFFIHKYFKMTNPIIWGIILILSLYLGPLIGSKIGLGFGASCALKFFLYFSLGFISFTWFNKTNVRFVIVLSSWILMFICFYLYNKYSNAFDWLSIRLIRQTIGLIFAIWGVFNMVFTCKHISISRITTTKTYYLLSKYNFQLYLYSDPFNYLLILAFIQLWGDNVFHKDTHFLFTYVLRFLTTTMLPLTFVFVTNKIRPKRIIKKDGPIETHHRER